MKSPDLLVRTEQFALDVLLLCDGLPAGALGWNLAKQLMRGGTSIGANYREAQRARSKAEICSKIGVCLQEREETQYWIELIRGIGPSLDVVPQLSTALSHEAHELCLIFMAISKKAGSP
jgi:four helix bundle protein